MHRRALCIVFWHGRAAFDHGPHPLAHPEPSIPSNLLQRVLHRFDKRIFGGVPSMSTELPGAHEALGEAPVPADWVLAGEPLATAHLLTRSPDGGFVTGLWECTPGRFRWYFSYDEVIVVMSGEATVRVGDTVHTLKPGVSVFFPVGTASEWEVHSTLRKHFTHRFPTPLARKLLHPAS